MRIAVNLLLRGLVLWVAWQLFPNVVQIDSTQTLIIATLLLWLVTLVVWLLGFVLMSAGLIFGDVGWIVAWVVFSLLMVVFASVVAMYILDANLAGFMINGFWPKLLLSICFGIVSIDKLELNC